MSFFNMRLIGAENLNRRLSIFNLEAQRKVKDVVNESALNIRNNAVQSMSETKTGQTYRRRTITHRASAPGEAPATDTARLKASVRARFFTGGLSAEIGTNVGYGRMLEFGTRNIAPRPWLNPAFEAERDNYINKLRDALRDASG